MTSKEKLKEKIDSVYSNLSGHNINRSTKIPNDLVVETYGELTINGYEQLLGDRSWEGYNFYDLGSGVGKVVMYSHLLSDFDKSIGVEFNKDRHNHAKTAQKKLSSKRKTRKTRKTKGKQLVFHKGNMFHKKYFNNNKNSVYFISNLCFTETMNAKLSKYFNKYRANKKYKTTIFSSKRLPELNYKSEETLNAHMTWNDSSNIYKYEL
jgi:hypothetical protein